MMDLSTRPHPLKRVTTKAEPLPSSSPDSGADAHEASRYLGVTMSDRQCVWMSLSNSGISVFTVKDRLA